MELIINDKTYTLKAFNNSRRMLIINDVLSFYDEKTKKTKEFYDKFYENLKKAIWSFLSSDDKKDIGMIKKLQIVEAECIKFINWCSEKIKKFCECLNKENFNRDKLNIVANNQEIYAFLTKYSNFNATFEQFIEMDCIEQLILIKEVIKLKKRSDLEHISKSILSGAYVKGNKKAKIEIKKLERGVKAIDREQKLRNMKPKVNYVLSREQLKKL
jgi:hypothetical protein